MMRFSVLVVCILMGFVAAAQNTEPTPPPSTESVDAANVEGSAEDWVEKTGALPSDSKIGESVLNQVSEIISGESTGATSGTGLNSGLDDTRDSLWRAFSRMISALAFVLALILGLYYLTRRFGTKVPVLAGAQLGKVLGKIYLSKDAALHFVQAGGRVLLVGVTPGGVQLVAEFDQSTFDANSEGGQELEDIDPEKFLAHLNQQTSDFNLNKEPDTTDDDISALRSDIRRLQGYLQEEAREPKE